MKKVLMVCVAALMMWSSFAFAADTVLFKNSSAAGWDIPVSESHPQGGLKQRLEKDGLLKDDAFPVAVLAQIAYNFAKEQNPAGELVEKDFKKAFLFANNLPFDGMITVDEFRRRGPAGQFVLPAIEARVSVTPTPEPVAAPAASVPSPKEVSAAGMANSTKHLSDAIATLNLEVNKLKASEGNQKALKELTARITTLNAQFTALKSGQTSFASATAIEAMKTEVAKLQAEMLGLAKLSVDMQAMQGRISTLEQNPLGGWLWYLLAALGALALGVVANFGFNAMNWRRNTKTTAAVASVQTEVKAVAVEVERVKKVGGFNEVQLPNFDQVISSLTKDSGSRSLEVIVDGEYLMLVVEMGADGKVMVHGINGQTNGVKPENLRKTIYRAGQLSIDGEHRIVGVTAKDAAEIFGCTDCVAPESTTLKIVKTVVALPEVDDMFAEGSLKKAA